MGLQATNREPGMSEKEIITEEIRALIRKDLVKPATLDIGSHDNSI